MIEKTTPPAIPKGVQWLDTASDFLDSRFRIPGTDIRFGADFLIGLVPYAGDMIGYGLSSVLVLAMVRNGASGVVVLKMLWNILLDVTIGSIPIFGDIFDLQYKANRRNLNLLLEHYEEGKHKGSAWPVIFLVLGLLIGMFFLAIFLIGKLVVWVLPDF